MLDGDAAGDCKGGAFARSAPLLGFFGAPFLPKQERCNESPNSSLFNRSFEQASAVNPHTYERIDQRVSAEKYGKSVFISISHFYRNCRQNKKPPFRHITDIFVFHDQMTVFLGDG